MKDPSELPTLARLRWTYRGRFDAVSMLVYVTVVYFWGLGAHPLGRDYAALATSGQDLPFFANTLFAWEMRLFGTWATGYQLVNMALMYTCMLCVYNLLNRTVKGVFWLGTLGAVLFMANPVHSEAVLNLSGIGDLLPCLIALAALLAYACLVDKLNIPRLLVAVALFALAALPYRENAFLFLVIVCYELLIPPPRTQSFTRMVPFIVLGLAALAIHGGALLAAGFDPARMGAPLYLVFYPIGLLPETARTLHESPWLGWLGAAGVVLVLILIHRKARRPAILFGLLAMAAVRLFQDPRPIDPVHMIGGGQLLLANALFVIGLVALFFRMMDHPRWRVTVIGFTTFLCVVFFILQIRTNLAWQQASQWTRHFQHQAAALDATPDNPLAVCPDSQYYQGAPVCLSESIRYDTPFSKAIPAVSILPLHTDEPERMNVSLDRWTPDHAAVTIEGKSPIDVVPSPYTLSRLDQPVLLPAATAALVRQDENSFTIQIIPNEATPIPTTVLPAKRQDEETEETTGARGTRGGSDAEAKNR